MTFDLMVEAAGLEPVASQSVSDTKSLSVLGLPEWGANVEAGPQTGAGETGGAGRDPG